MEVFLSLFWIYENESSEGTKVPARKAESGEQPLDRALAVLTGVVAAARPVSVTEIASSCDLPVPTAHRLVAQLESRGLVKRALGSKKVVVGQTLLALSLSALDAALRGDRPHQILLALSAELGEHTQVGVRSGNDVLYVDTASAPRSSGGLLFEQGRRAPLHCTSIGKIFLAELPEDEFSWWLSHTPLPAVTPRTLTKPASLRAIVSKVRKGGWAASDDEFATGVVGCAVPIRSTDGKLIAGLGISVPSARLPLEKLTQFRPKMEKAASAIARALEA
jgi:IclR family transcriptional regulator, acetate operon repressor